MLSADISASTLPDILTIIGSAGSVVGGCVALTLSSRLQRETLENLALGAAVGAVLGCFSVFAAYLITQLPG
jgi:hypothetical protein